MGAIAMSQCGFAMIDPRNYFPWSDSNGAWTSTVYTTPAFTFDEWFELAWRVRTLAFSGYYIEPGTGTQFPFNFTVPMYGTRARDGTIVDTVSNENLIRCQMSLPLQGEVQVDCQPHPTIPASAFLFFLFMASSVASNDNDISTVGFTSNIRFAYTAVGGLDYYITFLGKYFGGAGADGVIDVSIGEWWPYTHSLLGPIWDTATGAKLIDPVPKTR